MRNKRAIAYLIRRYLPLAALVFAAAFLAVPFWGILNRGETAQALARMAGTWDGVHCGRYLTDQLLNCIFGTVFLEYTFLIFGGIGFFSALLLFSHLGSRPRAMLTAALPVSPAADFLHRTAAFGALVLPGAALALAILPLTAAGLPGFGDVRWSEIAPRLGMLLVIIVYGYALGALARVLTGRSFAVLPAGIVLCGGLEIAGVMIRSLAGMYLVTMPGETSLSRGLFRLSPVYTLYKNLYEPGCMSLLPGLAAILLLGTAALLLYGRRRLERTGHPVVFPAAERILECCLPFISGLLFALAFGSMFERETLTLVMGLAGTAAGWAACRLVFTLRPAALLKKTWAVLLPMAMLLLLFAGLRYDLMGYDRYAPKADTTDTLLLTVYDEDYNRRTIELTRDGTLTEGIEYAACLSENARSLRGFCVSRGDSVTVTARSGNRTVTRCYPILNSAAVQPMIRAILGGEEYRRSLLEDEDLAAFEKALDDGTGSLYAELAVNSVLWTTDLAHMASFGLDGEDFSASVSRDEGCRAVLAALKKDIAARTADDLQGRAIARIVLCVNGEEAWHSADYPLYPCDRETFRAFFGDKADAVIDYAARSYVTAPDVLTLRETLDEGGKPLTAEAVSPEEALRAAETGFPGHSLCWSRPELRYDMQYAFLSRREIENTFGARFETDAEYAACLTDGGLPGMVSVPSLYVRP